MCKKCKVFMFIIFVLSLLFFGCDNTNPEINGNNSGNNDNSGNNGNNGNTGKNFQIGRIGTKFVAPVITNRSISRSLINQNEEISGMYFGLLDIVAYQYSPGFIDIDWGATWDGNKYGSPQPDWAHYSILSDSYAEARDIVLLNGGVIDLAALNPYKFTLGEHFMNNFNDFSIDFLEVNISSPAVFFNSILYGMNWAGNTEWEEEFRIFLHEKYPELNEFDIYNFDFPYYAILEGFPEIDIGFSIVFARNDWFPEPVSVRLSGWGGYGSNEPYTYEWSSKPLTDHQKELIEGLASNPRASWGRRSHFIIPYSYMYSFGVNGPVRLAVNENGDGLKNPEFRISFNFSKLLTTETYNNIISNGQWNQASGGEYPAFTFSSTNGIPFGLTANVVDLN